MKQLILSRYSGCNTTKERHWLRLISALVMCGYEVYADDDMIVFDLSDDDKVTEKKERAE